MSDFHIDINADIGEGLDNESTLMPYLTSCNIACGGHAGNTETMLSAIRLAKEYGVKIGAHPSFPDKKNFGRKPLKISCANLFISLSNQLRKFRNLLEEEQCQLHHIKPHGALYHLAANDKRTAGVMIEILKSLPATVKLYVPYNSLISKIAEKENIPVVYEAFVDRRYNSDGTLVSRELPNAVILEKQEAFSQLLGIVKDKKTLSSEGVYVDVKADTFCVHGDHPNACEILSYLNAELPKHHIEIH